MLPTRCFKRTVLFGCLCIFTLAALLGHAQSSRAAQVILAWDANSESNLAGYKVHYGTQSRVYTNFIDVGKTMIYTVAGLQEGATYYFAVTAYNVSRLESGYSNEVSSTTCAYSISPAGQSFGASGGSTTVGVTASPGCSWIASSGVQWVTITSGSSGTANGTVGLTVASNTGGARAGGISIAGETFTVTQTESSPTASSYTITASTGSGGSITPTGVVSVKAGASQTFRIKPGSRYRISSVTVDGRSVGAVSSYTFTSVNANHTISVTFSHK
jgi:fibronectin type 3 domain-containing protein